MYQEKLRMIRRGLRKPPKIIIQRIISEFQAGMERFISPIRERRFNDTDLLHATGTTSLEELWTKLGSYSYPVMTSRLQDEDREFLGSDEIKRIISLAEKALARQIDLLGTGPITIGNPIDWHKDYKTGRRWEPKFFRDIEYNNLDQPSDVKIPWEISRLQWLIPVGQAYQITGEERYAETVRDILDSWIMSNPYAHSVNWACTMEVAMRIITWTWFFHVFHTSRAWADDGFRLRFLRSVYLHGDFTCRHLEKSDINGNHYTADAAGLVFAGLFFTHGAKPHIWQKKGWEILSDELPRQVFSDGVDFEASIAYHRLVLELFFLPALYRKIRGVEIPDVYRNRIIEMARFAAVYSRDDGTVPLWGDADDARALPLGNQEVNDHRYLVGLVGATWGIADLIQFFSGSATEIFWILGRDHAALLCKKTNQLSPPSTAFSEGGFYVMRNAKDHIFIDCGSIGLAGRGGHGHNDCLSYEAVLDGVNLITDCGAYVYTASYKERNNFRSTAYHNTPMIDGEEMNRFIRPEYLWNMHNDAQPQCCTWKTGSDVDYFQGFHSGYSRLQYPVVPLRTIVLSHEQHALIIHDEFKGNGIHNITIPLHLAPNVVVTEIENECIQLNAQGKNFLLIWDDRKEWQVRIEPARVSSSYGVIATTYRIVWQRIGDLNAPLMICLIPGQERSLDHLEWSRKLLRTIK